MDTVGVAVITQLGLILAVLVSSLFGWLSARRAEQHVRPNGNGTIVEIVERNNRVLQELLVKMIHLDDRVDRIENEMGKQQ